MSRQTAPALALAAFAVIMLGAAPVAAQETDERPTQSMAGVIPGYEPSALERGIDRLPMLAEAFGAGAEAIGSDPALSAEERANRIAALWNEYGPEIIALALSAGETGVQTASTMLESMDIGAIVGSALAAAFAGLETAGWAIEAEAVAD